MSAANNGGPAFPIADARMVHTIGAAAIMGITDSEERDRVYTQTTAAIAAGMTLRDYAAIKALPVACNNVKFGQPGWQAELAWNAYSIADAMLAERSK